MDLSIIVAMTRNRVIGKDGKLPWDILDERRLFSRITRGNTVIMGRKTYESIGHPLKGRENIVVSRTLPETEGLLVARNLEDALAMASLSSRSIFSIGGEQIYSETLPLADSLLISYIKKDYEGDTYFPEFDPRDYQVNIFADFSEYEFYVYVKNFPETNKALKSHGQLL